MSPAVFDTDQVLLTKLAYWLQAAAEAVGGSNSTMLLPSMAAGPYDPPQVLLVKATYWAQQIAGGGGGGGGSGITVAAGDPPTDGSITTLFYKNSSDGTIYINSGSEAVPVWDSL